MIKRIGQTIPRLVSYLTLIRIWICAVISGEIRRTARVSDLPFQMGLFCSHQSRTSGNSDDSQRRPTGGELRISVMTLVQSHGAPIIQSIVAFTLLAVGVLVTGSQTSCKDNGIGSGAYGRYDLCYVKLIDNSWQVVSVDKASGRLINISNNPSGNDNPAYSPDGNQIAFTYHNPVGGTDIYLYRRVDNALSNLTPGSEYSAEIQFWVNNDEILFHYHKLGDTSKTYLHSLSTGYNRKVLDFLAKIYFLSDGDRFVYQPDGTDEYKTLYCSSLSGGQREALLDLSLVGEEYTSSFDFDPIRRRVLLLVAQRPRITNVLAEFDLTTKELKILSTADSGWSYLKPTYSSDCSKIACVARNYDSQCSSLILFDRISGGRTELITLRSEQAWLSLYKNAFSLDGRYLVYSKNVNQGGGQVYWESELFVYDLATGSNTFVDRGISPAWEP